MSQSLHGLKLRALVRDHLAFSQSDRVTAQDSHRAEALREEAPVLESVDLGVGAAMLVDDVAWILVEDRHDRALGVGLAWMHRVGAASLQIIVEESSGDVARKAQLFALDIGVWRTKGRELEPATVRAHGPEVQPAAEHLALCPVIADSGADVVIEHGVVTGEVLGLEVCRVVNDASSGSPLLQVGVGSHDREAFALMHADTLPTESLSRVVDVVRHHRRPDADPHPLNRLAKERALRRRILEDPTVVGVATLRPVSAATPRLNVKDPVPCAALGETDSGEPVVVVFSTGIDLDVVPTAADIRSWLGVPDAELRIVVPERDLSPVTQRHVLGLRRPATFVGVPEAR